MDALIVSSALMRSGMLKLPVVLALLVAIGFLYAMLVTTDGHFAPQVVDLYLVCQYARAMAEGHPFQYNPGEPPSTGATSLLHTALLAGAHAVGIRGEGLIAFAIGVGAVLFVVSVWLSQRIAGAIASPDQAFLAGALVALSGPVAWGFLYGSDIALFLMLSLLLLDRMLAAWRGEGATGLAVAGGLLSLARPEGLLIGLILGTAYVVGPGRDARPRHRFLAFVPALVGLLVVSLNRALTGQWLSTSVADKSLVPNYGLLGTTSIVAEYLTDVVRGLLLGLYPSVINVGFAQGWAALYFPPLGLIFVLLALAPGTRSRQSALRVWGLVLGLMIALSPNVFIGIHFNRHILWTIPSLLVMAAVGLGVACRSIARGDQDAAAGLFRWGAGLWLLLGLLSVVRFAGLYGESAGSVYRRDVRTAQWISENLPRGTAIASIATSVEYLTGHRNLNLHGVTSPAFFGDRTAEREAGMVEALARLSPAERPSYLISSVSVQEASGVMRELVQGQPLFRSSGFGDELLVFRTRFDLLGKNQRLFLPETQAAVRSLREVDRLNVCDARDEAAHHYSVRSRLDGLTLHATARLAAYPPPLSEPVLDAGRAVIGEESFAVSAAPGRDLILVMRTAPSASVNLFRPEGKGVYGLEIADQRISIEIDGQTAGRTSHRPRSGWDELVLRIPGALIREGRSRVSLSGHYTSYYYWFFQ